MLLLCISVLVLLASTVPAVNAASFPSSRDGVCPDLRDYTRHHWRMLMGHEKEQRWLVITLESGYNDRLLNLVSGLLVAIVTGRALCVQPDDRKTFSSFQVASESPNIDWECHGQPWANSSLSHYTHSISGGTNLASINTPFYQEFILGGDLQQSLGAEAAQANTLRMFLNKGISFELLTNNLVHSVELQRLGLRPDTAFGCLVHYLLRPKPETFWLVPRPLLALMTDEQVIKIGIQIRFGDAMISLGAQGVVNDTLFDMMAEPFFRCARELEADILLRRSAAARVVYFLMTDSHAARTRALERYERDEAGRPKLFVYNSSVAHSKHTTDSANKELVMEQWLLSQAHFFIITRGSGLGRCAAMMSLRQSHIFTVITQNDDHGMRSSRHNACTLGNYDTLEGVHADWSGF